MDTDRAMRVGPLTGLRFLAALGILAFHYGAPLLEGAPRWAVRIQGGGHVWVGLFYVLSGFVLAVAHPDPMDSAQRRTFLAARLSRLYPAYALAFVLAAPFALEHWPGDGGDALAKAAVVGAAALLLVQAWLPPIARLWNAPGWSTSVIASFYVAFPFVTARLSRLRRGGLAGLLCGAWALSLAFPAAWLVLEPDGPGALLLAREPPWLEALKFHPVPRAGEFLAGVALGLLHRRGVRLARGGDLLAGGAAVAVLAILALDAAPYVFLHNGLLVPLFAAIVLGLADARGGVARALGCRPARIVGEASFALYALQDPLWRWARTLSGSLDVPATPAFVVGFAATAIGISVAVSAGLERPARRMLRARLAPAPAAAPALPSAASASAAVPTGGADRGPPDGARSSLG